MSASANAARAETAYPTIVKPKQELRLGPNLVDYDRTCHHFTWECARLMLEGLPQGRGLNIAHEAVDRHAAGPLANHLALRWIGTSGTIWDFTYARLRQLPAESAQDRVDEGGLGIGLIRALRAIAHVPHDLQGAGDLALEALLDGTGERHEGGLSYR